MPPSPKTRRQATACDWCRSHKVKCDTQQPSCRNCVQRGVPCVTVNLRKPRAEGERRAPKGRRSRDRPQRSSLSTAPRTPADAAATGETVSSSEGRNGSAQARSAGYTQLPQEFSRRTVEAQSPDMSLPALFATPFDRESLEDAPRPDSSAGAPTTGQPRDRASVTLVTDRSSHRRQAVDSGSSQYVLVQWLDLFFAQCPTWTPIFPFVRQGLAYSLDVPLPFPVMLPSFPDHDTARRYGDLFFSRIYPVFPVIDRNSFQRSLSDIAGKLGSPPGNLEAQDYPTLACAYAVFSAAADEEAGDISVDGTRYMQAAYFLYAHLVATPYLASVQALLLLTLILRDRSKDGASWSTLSQAVCIAQSIGLHRHVREQASSPPGATPTDEDLYARIWWTAYILERTMALETGRPSLIRDEECDQIIPADTTASPAEDCPFDYFKALIRLAQIKARAIGLLYGGRNQRQPVRALLIEMGKIDRALVDWAETFPESIRDLFCGAKELHLATFTSLQYHQTMIALHRPALMSAPGFLHNRIGEYCAGTPWHDRLRFSLCIGAASARFMLKAVGDLLMYAGPSRIITVNQILLAVLVLAIYVTKVPASRMNSADLALLSTFAEQIEDEYVRMGQDSEFAKGLGMLRRQMHEYRSSLKPGRADADRDREASVLPQGLTFDATLGDLDADTDVANLEESWSHFWNEDFGAFLSHGTEQDMANTYLLGLPQSWA